ncbi:MAG: DUF433 domain-containing protein [Caldilineaceae bacterium]|nr:DUF433 domain-containing protein [Caldilineaceae bacterium]
MKTWNYRVFREETGEYVIREVFYDEDGAITGRTEDAVEPMGDSLEELERDLEHFRDALRLPVLTLAEVDAAIVKQPSRPKHTGPNISHEELVAQLGLQSTHAEGDDGSGQYDSQAENIEIDPEKLSGTPVFPGTRVPIQNLFDCLEAGESVEEFLDQFPTVAYEQAIRVLEASKEKLIAGYEAVA